jgi:hypothetical protein
MTEVKPSNVRTRVLHEYATLRTSIDELEASAVGLSSDGEPSVPEVLARCAKLFRELSDYIDLEQLFVLPTVRSADAWGDLRAQALQRHHAGHRAELGAFNQPERSVAPAPAALASGVHVVTHALRETLEREKSEILSAELLRDDVVGLEVD